MAVVDPEFNLAPSYALVQQALQNRANIMGSSGASNPLSTINAIAEPIVKQEQLASAQQFELDKIRQKSMLDLAEKKATTTVKPKVLVTPEGVDEFLDAYGIDEAEKKDYKDLFADMVGKEVNEDEARDEAHRRISLRETQKTRKETAADRARLQEQRQEDLQAERANKREQQRDDKILQYTNDLEKNPAVKKMREQDISTTQVDTLIALAKDGNTIAATASGAKMAKAMGEVGVLTDEDIKRYVRSGALGQGAADKLKKMIDGAPTTATLDEIQQIGGAMRTAYQEKIGTTYNNYVRRLAINYDMSTQEAATRLDVPYTGNPIKRLKNKAGDVKVVEFDAKTGKPIKEFKLDAN